jgi:predicted DCC family thiol-disulfide oxidoreductase YuxK
MRHLILFDGVCGLCSRLNQFVLPRDHARVFAFAPLQGELARALVARHGKNPDDLDTFLVVVDHGGPGERVLARARAALFVLGALGWPWALAGVLGVLPTRLLDAIYRAVARRRYAWFGRVSACARPTPEQRARFLE